jgi:ADP-ribose pyrophosphatase YjhB (NUDIX family)
MSDKIKRYINESDDFEWAKDILPADEYRFFEVYVCYSSFYDEDTGEDECNDGASYFIKIPVDVVPEIWDYDAEADYYAGPGDEGEKVIQWCIENSKMGVDVFDYVEYVTEITKDEYCNSWGKWKPDEEGLCWESVNESDDFDWTVNVSDNPLRWVKPEINLDNVERDEEGYPLVMGDGQGEIWVDVTDFTETQKRSVISSIEELLGSTLTLISPNSSYCFSHQIKGFLIHCGHEDNDFFSQENHVCCMGDSYQDFIETDGYRPYVDGSIFFDDTKQDLTEGTMYYKGVNPTVDFIVRRDDEILLIKRGSQSEKEPNKWALPGGFHDSNAKEGGRWKQDKESTLEAAKRELKEETGLDLSKFPDVIIEKVGTFEGVGRQPEDESWVETTVYKTTIPNDAGNDVKGMDDAQDAKWFTVYEAMNMDLAFNHKDHIEKSLVLVEDAFSDMSIGQLLIESNDFDWAREIPDEVDFDLWLSVSGYIDDELSGPPMDIIRRRPKFKQLRSILEDFDLDIEYLEDFFEFPPTLKNGEPMDNDELINLKKRLVDGGFIYEGDDLYESVTDDFEWVENRTLTKNSLIDILSDCEDILITTYNLTINHPYTKRGEFVRYYISTCPYWWDRLPNNEWLRDGDRGKNKVAIIMPKNNKSQKNIRDLKDDEFEVVTTPIGMCVTYFNANSSFGELWIFLDNNEQPIYDFIPKEVIESVKQGFSEYHGENINESDDFEWVKDIEPQPFYIGGKFIDTQDHDDELIYTVDDISGGVVKLSWYSGGEHQVWDDTLSRLEDRYENGYIIPMG